MRYHPSRKGAFFVGKTVKEHTAKEKTEQKVEKRIGSNVQNMISPQKPSRKRKKKRKILRFAVSLAALLFLIPLCGVLLYFRKDVSEWSSLMRSQVNESVREDFIPSNVSYIYDKDGNEIAKLSMSEKNVYLKFRDLPKDAVNAFVAVEDRAFWENRGYDLKGIFRAIWEAVRSKGDTLNGASTITQQLARKIYLSNEISLERKIKEIMAAAELTKQYTKAEIMEFYVNNCCFANNIYGIEAAAQIYFGKSAKDLTLSQTAYLCAIPNRPAYYDPFKSKKRAIKRRNKILQDMHECGYINDQELSQAKGEKIKIRAKEESLGGRVNNYQTTYATDCAVRYLMGQRGFLFRYHFNTHEEYKEYLEGYQECYADIKEELYVKGYKIHTSLDSQAQDALQSIVDNSLNMDISVGDSGMYDFQGALTAIDNSTGKVAAIIGGRSQEGFLDRYTLNRAYQSYRQPGSSVKPLIVYLPALMKGYSADSTLKNIDVSAAKKSKAVSALGGYGVSLRQAVEQSKNGCAYWLSNEIGVPYGLSFLKEMKFDRIVPEDETLSSALGGLTYGVTTEQMAGAYAAIVNQGKYREPTCIQSISDIDGNSLYEDAQEKAVYDRSAASEMIDILKGVLLRGTAASMKWGLTSGVEAAGKTGTTNDSKDGWFCGFTPYYTISVWVGYDAPKRLGSLYGSTYPAAIWKDAMKALLDGHGYTEGAFFPDEAGPKEESEEGAGEEFLPGRPDSEVLSDGYTVADYRADRRIGKEIYAVIAQIEALSPTSPDYFGKKEMLHQKGMDLIGQIYSRKYTLEMQQALDAAFVK